MLRNYRVAGCGSCSPPRSGEGLELLHQGEQLHADQIPAGTTTMDSIGEYPGQQGRFRRVEQDRSANDHDVILWGRVFELVPALNGTRAGDPPPISGRAGGGEIHQGETQRI